MSETPIRRATENLTRRMAVLHRLYKRAKLEAENESRPDFKKDREDEREALAWAVRQAHF